jgi:hypothetical protein
LEIVRSIESGAPLPIPADEALGSLELCMAVYESAIKGAEVALPLGPESVVYEGLSKEKYAGRLCSRQTTHAAGEHLQKG